MTAAQVRTTLDPLDEHQLRSYDALPVSADTGHLPLPVALRAWARAAATNGAYVPEAILDALDAGVAPRCEADLLGAGRDRWTGGLIADAIRAAEARSDREHAVWGCEPCCSCALPLWTPGRGLSWTTSVEVLLYCEQGHWGVRIHGEHDVREAALLYGAAAAAEVA